jgi:hypothetical protein
MASMTSDRDNVASAPRPSPASCTGISYARQRGSRGHVMKKIISLPSPSADGSFRSFSNREGSRNNEADCRFGTAMQLGRPGSIETYPFKTEADVKPKTKDEADVCKFNNSHRTVVRELTARPGLEGNQANLPAHRGVYRPTSR